MCILVVAKIAMFPCKVVVDVPVLFESYSLDLVVLV
jgi:hypothetical protein